jgi:hypothetical protein
MVVLSHDGGWRGSVLFFSLVKVSERVDRGTAGTGAPLEPDSTPANPTVRPVGGNGPAT